jgi:dTMP kinase
MFIVFEGIDGCGKSTLTKRLSEKTFFHYTREPTFSSKEADELNLNSKNELEREIEFAIDRIAHNERTLKSIENIICDRYIWTGLTYCKFYNPSSFDFVKTLYSNKFFRIPDLYVFVDTPVEICSQRKQDQPIDHLKAIRNAYLETKGLLNPKSKMISIESVGNADECLAEVYKFCETST